MPCFPSCCSKSKARLVKFAYIQEMSASYALCCTPPVYVQCSKTADYKNANNEVHAMSKSRCPMNNNEAKRGGPLRFARRGDCSKVLAPET